MQDSNLRSFRDGFTVRSHWPLGQSAVLFPTTFTTVRTTPRRIQRTPVFDANPQVSPTPHGWSSDPSAGRACRDHRRPSDPSAGRACRDHPPPELLLAGRACRDHPPPVELLLAGRACRDHRRPSYPLAGRAPLRGSSLSRPPAARAAPRWSSCTPLVELVETTPLGPGPSGVGLRCDPWLIHRSTW